LFISKRIFIFYFIGSELKAELEAKPIIKKSITPQKPKKRKHIAIESEKIKGAYFLKLKSHDPATNLIYSHNRLGEAPPNWKEIYTKIEQMRSEVQAPVDIYGCERLSGKDRLPQKVFNSYNNVMHIHFFFNPLFL